MIRSIFCTVLLALGCVPLAVARTDAQALPPASQPRAARAIPPDGAVLATLPSGAWAMTICRSEPITWFSKEMPDSARGMVEAHEAEHRRHMSSFGSCQEFWTWRKADPEHEVIAEARGFCAGAKYERARGAHPSFLVALQSQALVFENYHVWGLEDALAAIIRNCDTSRPNAPWPEPRWLSRPGSG